MQLSRPLAFYLQASIILFFLAGSSAPTPLYAVYQAAWGFSPITITIIFGSYAVTVLATLLVVGSLSDHIGRRPVLLAATLLQAATMLVFIRANGLPMLLAARIAQGIATGAAAGAVGAGMLDLDRAKGTLTNAIAPMLGTATGALLSGLLVQFLPAPTQLVYAILAAVYVIQFAGVLAMPESVTPRAGAMRSLRPQVHVPAHRRSALKLATPALVAAWALTGFYGALAPTLLRRMLATSSPAIGGLALFAMAVSGVGAVLALRQRDARMLMTFGTGSLILGVLLTLAAIPSGSAVLFFLGAMVSGAGFGGAFQGAIRAIVPFAAPHERAGVLSVVYILSYLALGVPAVIGGWRVVHGGGIYSTAREYGIAVMLLAAVALVGTLRQRPARVPAVA